MHDYSNYRYITNNNEIPLSIIENELLYLLMKNKGNIITYKQICQQLFGSKNVNVYKGILSVSICRLRKKLKDEIIIVTRNKIGYMIK